jgi:phage protein D
MAINDPAKQEGARQPRARVLLNGSPMSGVLQAETANNSNYQADKFTVHFALYADAAYGPDWWGKQKELLLDTQFSVDDGDNWTSMVIGDVDHLTMDPIHGVVTVEGRDLSSRLIDTKTVKAYRNQTASAIAESLATEHNLTADVQATTEKVGRFYDQDHDRIQHDQFSTAHTEWDLLVMLAHHEGFDCWVTGTTLHFKPFPDLNADPYEVVWRRDDNGMWSNAQKLTLERSLTLAKDVVVAVRSFNSQQKYGFTMYSPSGVRQAAIQSGKAQLFTFSRPNMDRDQAQKEANRLREEISKNEKLLHFSRPADLTLSCQNVVKLRGLADSWDQVYYINAVNRTLNNSGGFEMTVSLKNHSVESSATVT